MASERVVDYQVNLYNARVAEEAALAAARDARQQTAAVNLGPIALVASSTEM
jgi:hypothetical protein